MNRKLQTLRTELQAVFPERREVIDGILASILAKEHAFLLGKPGTAKSAMIRVAAGAFQARTFEILMTKTTVPEEVFGPVAMSGLMQDRFARVTKGRLAEVEIAFLDEIFKSNSSILNSLLTIFNERVFHNDGVPQPCPIVSIFGASNELPEGKELEALFDRFLFRFDVGYLLRPDNFRKVMLSGEPTITTTITIAELAQEQANAAAIPVSDSTIDAMIQIRDACKADGIEASDRRWKKIVKIARVSAYLAGEVTTSPEDLTFLSDVLWREPKDRPKIARLVGQYADPIAFQAAEILDAAKEIAAKVSAIPKADRKTYLAQADEARQQFVIQQKKLGDLVVKAGARSRVTIADATSEITALQKTMIREMQAMIA